MREPKSTFFQTQLEWPPIDDFAIPTSVVLGLFNKMFEPGEYRYDNLSLGSDKPTLYREVTKGQSLCQFSKESITIEESHDDATIGTFKEVVEIVLGALEEDEIPPFFMQRVRIQCLCDVSGCNGAVDLLAGKVANVFSAIEPFRRPPRFFGIRFRFPPVSIITAPESVVDSDGSDDDTIIERAIKEGRLEEKAGFVTLRMETHAKDINQVWMELAGTYPHLDEPMALADMRKITRNIQSAYEFLTNNAIEFLNQFDKD
jgi:hypothetical protein